MAATLLPEDWASTTIQLQPDLQTEAQTQPEAQTEGLTDTPTPKTTSNHTGESVCQSQLTPNNVSKSFV